jgi:hypothetical protein
VLMIRMSHEVTIIYTGRKDGKLDMEFKKPYAVVQCRPGPSNYTVLRKTLKIKKKLVLCLLNCVLLNM